MKQESTRMKREKMRMHLIINYLKNTRVRSSQNFFQIISEQLDESDLRKEGRKEGRKERKEMTRKKESK